MENPKPYCYIEETKMKNLPAGVWIVIIAIVLAFASCIMNGVSIYNRNHPPKSAEEKKQEEWNELYEELTKKANRLETGRVISVNEDLYEVSTPSGNTLLMKCGYNIKPKVGSRIIYYDGADILFSDTLGKRLILKVMQEQTVTE